MTGQHVFPVESGLPSDSASGLRVISGNDDDAHAGFATRGDDRRQFGAHRIAEGDEAGEFEHRFVGVTQCAIAHLCRRDSEDARTARGGGGGPSAQAGLGAIRRDDARRERLERTFQDEPVRAVLAEDRTRVPPRRVEWDERFVLRRGRLARSGRDCEDDLVERIAGGPVRRDRGEA